MWCILDGNRNENDVEAIPGVDSGDAGWNNVMTPEITELAVEIVRFVDDYQPGIVACEFFDAEGYRPQSSTRYQFSVPGISTQTAMILNRGRLGARY